jgi:ABC-type polysaccharide/polyol phosphate export permease
MEGTQSLTANAGLLRKAVFPAEVLPMVSVLSNLVHFLFAVPILVAGLIVGRLLGYPIGGWTAVLFPVVVALQLPALGGLTLGLSALNVHFKDVKDIVGNLLALLFYMTPIIYPLDFLKAYPPLVWAIEWLNPFTPYARAYQAVLFQGVLPEAQIWMQMIGWSSLLWLSGSWLFGRLSDSLVEAV